MGSTSTAGRFSFGRGDSLRLGVAIAVPHVPWVVVSSTTLSEFGRVFLGQRNVDVVLLIAISCGVLITFLMLVSRATRSLEELTLAARAVGRGDLDPKLPSSSDDEVGVLSATFGDMAERIRVMMRDLEVSRQLAVLGEFSTYISHEIRNPLTSLQLELQGLLRDVRRGTLGDDALRSLETCLRETKRLDHVARGAVALGRPREIDRQPTDGAVIVRAAHAAVNRELAERQISVDERIETSITSLVADAEAVQGAVINLLRNAADAQPAGGKIIVALRSAADGDGTAWIHIIVADDGTGVDDDMADRIFRPFVTSKPDGTGLGLPLAMRVAGEHGGALTLVAPDPAWGVRGAAFCMTLPILAPAVKGSTSAGRQS
jgi:signal transduction histidine kinase